MILSFASRTFVLSLVILPFRTRRRTSRTLHWHYLISYHLLSLLVCCLPLAPLICYRLPPQASTIRCFDRCSGLVGLQYLYRFVTGYRFCAAVSVLCCCIVSSLLYASWSYTTLDVFHCDTL